MITGSRDRSIRIWRLGTFGTSGGITNDEVIKTVRDAHQGSILSLSFELENQGHTGTMLTGSSDCSVGIWDLFWVTDGKDVRVDRTGTLRGHEHGVLDVKLGRHKIVARYVSIYDTHFC